MVNEQMNPVDEKGRVMVILTDSLWRWAFDREGRGHRVYRSIYARSLRWLIGDPTFSYVRMKAAAPLDAGKEETVEVEVMGPDYSPLPGANRIRGSSRATTMSTMMLTTINTTPSTRITAAMAFRSLRSMALIP